MKSLILMTRLSSQTMIVFGSTSRGGINPSTFRGGSIRILCIGMPDFCNIDVEYFAIIIDEQSMTMQFLEMKDMQC
jgi:hypothetical protein